METKDTEGTGPVRPAPAPGPEIPGTMPVPRISRWKNAGASLGGKFVLVCLVMAVLAVLIAFQDGLVEERIRYHDGAVDRTVEEWGGRSGIMGPFLAVRWTREVVTKETTDLQEGWFWLSPGEFRARTDLTSTWRTRGLYRVPLYTAALDLSGSFDWSPRKDWFPEGAKADWNHVYLVTFLEDSRALVRNPEVTLAGNARDMGRLVLEDRQNGRSRDSLGAVCPGLDGNTRVSPLPFHIRLDLRGGKDFSVYPLGSASSRVDMQSDWPWPEFRGSHLPSSRTVSQHGFTATWEVPALARNLGDRGVTWPGEDFPRPDDMVETAFPEPVDPWRMSGRTVKYALLFIAIPFGAFFLFEVLSRRRIHPLQYLLMGLAVTIFHLLLLSLSERIGFDPAFLVSAAAASVLCGCYGVVLFGGPRQGLLAGAGMGLLYFLLWLITGSEENALLTGSILLFVLLGLAMFLTRKLDWYSH